MRLASVKLLTPKERDQDFKMSRILLIALLSLIVVFGVVASDSAEEDSLISSYVYCIFVEKACTDEQVAHLQMQVAAFVATIDEKEALGLGGFPDKDLENVRAQPSS